MGSSVICIGGVVVEGLNENIALLGVPAVGCAHMFAISAGIFIVDSFLSIKKSFLSCASNIVVLILDK